jgi:D-amino-acid dehydrogenase
VTGAPDVVVVGAGAIGLSAALEMARAGARVTVLERGSTVGAGCSPGAAGLINVTHATPLATPDSLRAGLGWMLHRDSPFVLHPRPRLVPWLARFVRAALTPEQVRAASELLGRLARGGRALHESMESRGVPTGYRRSGILYTFAGEDALRSEWRKMHAGAADDARVELLDTVDARRLVPDLASGIAGAIHCPDEGHVDPAAYLAAVAQAARDAGVVLRTGVEVRGLERAGLRVVALDTSAGRMPVGQLVVAAGVWSGTLARSLGLRLWLEGAAGYNIDLASSNGRLHLPVYLHEARIVATPLKGRLRLAGTLELGGGDGATAGRLDAIMRAARTGLDHLGASRDVIRTWRGLRPCTPDGLPLLGRSARCENAIFATGHAHLGLVLAPVTARIVAALAAGRDPGWNLASMSPDRF